MLSSDEDSCDTTPQPVQAHFSVSIRSSRRRRNRLSRPPTPPSACEESAHYPVFNPEDPRHNPALRTTVLPDNTDSPPQVAHLTGSRHWMQTLPGRSLRRARSGLQALRSGLHRRSVNQNADGSILINGVWPSSDSTECSSDQHERFFSSTVSEASTEEDYDFGTHLYRTGCNYPDFSDEICNNLVSQSNTEHSHPTILPSAATGAEARPTELFKPTPDDSPGENLSPVTFKSDNSGPINTQLGMHEGQPADEPTTFATLAPSVDAADSPVRSMSRIGSSAANTSEAMTPSEELTTVNLPVHDIRGGSHPNIEAENTNVALVSRASSSKAPWEIQSVQTPIDDTGFLEKYEHTPTEDTSTPGSPQTENVVADSESTPEEGTVSKRQLDSLIVPDVALGDFGELDYFLSLNSLDDTDLPGSKSSDEDPSPNSLSEDDANGPINPWIPLEKGDRTSLLSLRDEYFLVDGKSTDLRPDRGDNPIKGERVFSGDGGLHSGPGLDRSLSLRTQEIPEIIGPGGPIGIPSPLPLRVDREGSDSTEEYLVTYSLLHRHYFS
ncbi:hypothetical protein BJX64DRAFT_189816 [Aspergillus heterothallicus]